MDAGMVDDPREPGQYAGYLSSSGQVGRLLFSMFWGRFSDRHGRKVVLQISLMTTVVTAVAFGLTLNFWLAVAIRFVSGAMDFSFGIVKVYVSEGIDERYRATAMSWSGATWGTAVICGPTLGGLLARPAVQYPTVFAADGIFGVRPYLLPFVVVSGVAILALILSELALKEPVPDAIGLRGICCTNAGGGQLDSTLASQGKGISESRDTRRSRLRFFCQRKPALAMLFYTLLITSEFADEVTFPLWAAAPSSAGGLQFLPFEIGRVMGATGALIIVTQIFVYPALHRLMGPLSILRWFAIVSAVLTPVMPMATWPTAATSHPMAQVWSCLVVGRVLRLVSTEFVFTANSIIGARYSCHWCFLAWLI
jgi:MFS family permease